jgi:hypothetical protein
MYDLWLSFFPPCYVTLVLDYVSRLGCIILCMSFFFNIKNELFLQHQESLTNAHTICFPSRVSELWRNPFKLKVI